MQIYAVSHKQRTTTCLSLRNNTACCIPLRDLRYLRENIHARVLNLLAQMKPHISHTDHADNRRQPPNSNNLMNHINLSFSAK
jgi:hypothetical protein